MIEWFDDLKLGMRFKSEGMAVSKDDIIRFAREYDPQPFHLDDEAARKTVFKGLAADTTQALQRLGYQSLTVTPVLAGAPTKSNPDGKLELWLEIPPR